MQRICDRMAPFVPRQRKHKARRRAEDTITGVKSDPKAVEILPAAQIKNEDKRKTLKHALRSERLKISSKKQKRLDKYIVGVLHHAHMDHHAEDY